MNIRSQIINSTSREAGVALLKSALRKPGISGRTKNRLRHAIPKLEARLRSERSKKAAATVKARKLADTEITPTAISETKPKTRRATRKAVEATLN